VERAEIGKLYVVATPIGNLRDVSTRMLQVLSEVDFVLCEDTRVTGGLLHRFEIKAPMFAHHKFNERGAVDDIVTKMLNGSTYALVSDAGTPGICDPGAMLVAAASYAGVDIICVPGVSAVAAALSVSGFDASEYAFYGFLPKGNQMKKRLEAVAKSGVSLSVFFESPHRVLDTLTALTDIMPAAQVALCNDLTKKYEKIYRGTPCQVLDELKINAKANKGEYVLVVYSPTELRSASQFYCTSETDLKGEISTEALLVDICVKNGVSLKEAVAELHGRSTGLAKREIYSAGEQLKRMELF